MTSVSTHVLDTAQGRPAAGIPVTLSLWTAGGWQRLGDAATGPDGRVTGLPEAALTAPARLKLEFDVGGYLTASHGAALFPGVTVHFVAAPGEHYHLPLLLSPFGYTTYRGS
jgi:hydroxyisourate hydrolase